MGQLERYGLYVLCVVIVLILGVAIWGGDTGPLDTPATAHELDRALTSPSARADSGGGRRAEPPLSVDPNLANPPSNRVEERFFDRVGPVGAELSGVTPVEEPVENQIDVKDATAPTAIEAPRSKPKPESRALRTYTVREGDTMEGISKRVLKSTAHVDTIQKLNPRVNPKRMRPGDVLKLPWLKNQSAPAPDVGAPRAEWTRYTVVKGDSASAISQKVYKTQRYANDILDWNRIADAGKLRPKQVLELPPLR